MCEPVVEGQSDHTPYSVQLQPLQAAVAWPSETGERLGQRPLSSAGGSGVPAPCHDPEDRHCQQASLEAH